jgi:hypothetical protein
MSLGPKSNFIPVIYAGTKKKIKKTKKNAKIVQGATSGDGNDAKGKSKSKVDPAIFRMAEERDY